MENRVKKITMGMSPNVEYQKGFIACHELDTKWLKDKHVICNEDLNVEKICLSFAAVHSGNAEEAERIAKRFIDFVKTKKVIG